MDIDDVLNHILSLLKEADLANPSTDNKQTIKHNNEAWDKVLKSLKGQELNDESIQVLNKRLDKEITKKPILLVCALKEEKEALEKIISDNGIKYLTISDSRTLQIQKNRKVIIIECFFEMGNTNSLARTNLFIEQYDPVYALLFGIAAGFPDKVNLGDVIMTQKVVDLRKFAIDQVNNKDRYGFSPEHFKSPSPIDLFNTQQFAKQIGSEKGYKFNIHSDLKCGSSDVRNKSDIFFEDAILTDRKLGILEMEAAGFADSCCKNNIPFIIMKSASDYGDVPNNAKNVIK